MVCASEAKTLAAITSTLEQAGFDVVGFSKGEAALAWLEQHWHGVVVIISDTNLDGMNGELFYINYRQLCDKGTITTPLPFLFFTALGASTLFGAPEGYWVLGKGAGVSEIPKALRSMEKHIKQSASTTTSARQL